jgi:hypothetical protein
LQAVSQHRPSAQLPLAHWDLLEQLPPLPSGGLQMPAEHQSPGAQSASVTQSPRQAFAPQTYAPHDWVCTAGQWPAPSQDAGSVAAPAEQLPARHWLIGYAQVAALTPSQAPPQPEPSDAQAWRAPCGAPVAGAQVPTLPATSHAWHCPAQAALQHTPSTQKPEPHWSEAAQLAPFPRLGAQMPAEQKFPAAQSESTAQSPRQAVAPQTYGSHDCV